MKDNSANNDRPFDSSPHVSDEIRKTTCYMCACRCGINVHLRDGRVRYIEGNRDHPVNKGVLCAKGAAGIMQHYAPSRLQAPLLRTGPRGSGKFKEIGWDEALQLAVSWLKPVRETAPRKLAFFTGRDQSQSLTSFWAQQFGTPNYAAHGGFCSVNMAAAGIYTMGGAFWEFGAPDWERTKYFVIFGVAEDHDSNPIKMGLSTLKRRGVKTVAVNPVRTGYNAVADEWVGITPGTDGLFILAIARELMRTGNIDIDFLLRYTNAPWLVICEEGTSEEGLFARGSDDKPLVVDRESGAFCPFDKALVKPALKGSFTLPDGRKARPVFEMLAEHLFTEDHSPDVVAKRCGIPATTIKRLAAEIAEKAFQESITIEQPWTDMRGQRHERFIGRPVSFHAMRGISAHSNGFQTCRTIHVLQLLLGSVDCPGGFRFKPPYPKPVETHPRPHCNWQADTPLNGPHLGFPRGPEDLALNDEGQPERIDKAFSWEAPLSVHGLMHMVISNAYARDPYGIDVLFMYMANMAWNSSMNTRGTMEMLTATDENGDYIIPKIIYSDAYSSEMVAYADLILPDTTYLERHDCISLLDRPISEPEAAADAIRWPVVQPDRNVRCFQSALIQLGAMLELPGFVDESGDALYKDYEDYILKHERRPGIGPLSGWREDGNATGRGAPNPAQLDQYIENGGFHISHIPPEAQFFKAFNADYQKWAVGMGFFDAPQPYVYQLYVETLAKFRLAARGYGDHQPPDHLRDRIDEAFDPLPVWYPPFAAEQIADFPLHALTQRPAAMYHAWGSQNAWLRQIHGRNPLYVPGPVCDAHGLEDGDWAWLISHHSRIKVPVARMDAVNGQTVWTWNAIGKRKGSWALSPDAPEATKGFLLNHLICELLPEGRDGMRWSNSDPITGQAAWYDLRVRIEKASPADECEPGFPPLDHALDKKPDGGNMT